MNEDQLIELYAQKAENIYKNKTAGDFTWHGLLAEFTRELREL